ncbi:MAG: acetyl-CoA carboxylase biotin carboxyl carrier protein [Magnetococcales bacterium]|nr:acetyl-CoA carboxylase biotin carboxyl carrier protein [Magnetococcales bacterium]
MELKEIRQLVKMLDGTDVSEIEIVKDGETVRISRAVDQPAVMPIIQQMAPMAAAPAPMAPAPAAAAKSVAGSETAAEAESLSSHQVITSPMVGTFYRSPSPEAPNFVQPGDVIKKGQVVCIIEAMKLMNEIESEVDGRVVRAIKDNASPVEFGDELFHIEPV